jgi:hypothetical protein
VNNRKSFFVRIAYERTADDRFRVLLRDRISLLLGTVEEVDGAWQAVRRDKPRPVTGFPRRSDAARYLAIACRQAAA